MKKRVLFLIFGLLVLAACAPSGSSVAIENAWGRSSPSVATAGAFYMTIRNAGGQADRLTSVKSLACGMAELHESYQTEQGAMGMRPVTGGSIEIPANGSVELKAGGLHIMCMDKKVDFKPGTKVSLTLAFAQAGEKSIEAEIK